MFCSRCGAPVGDADIFCGACGSPVERTQVPTATPGVPPPVHPLTYSPLPSAPPLGAPEPSRPRSAPTGQPTPVYRAGQFNDPETGQVLSGWWRRVWAYVLDGLVIGVPSFIVTRIAIGNYLTTGSTSCNDLGACHTTFVFHQGAFLETIAFQTIVACLYFVLLVGSARGQSVGMMALGISVRDATTGTSIGYGRAFVRYIVIYALTGALVLPLLIDLLSPLWDRRRQAWHDHAADSVVVDLR
jgi:uncharacterized RDD family membrane protein YckC